jgi:DNA polymerase-1
MESKSIKNTFVLIDGNAILHRAYHAMPRFEVDGRLVNAIYGFISILFSAIEKHHPEYLAVAFDVKGPTFRDKIFDEYKAKRIKPPQEFYDQIVDVWDFVKTMEIPLLTKEGFEADDIIGTLAKRVNGDLGEGEVIIVTGDQDTLQLVDQRTKVAMPAMGKTKETLYDPSAVLGKFGLEPVQIIDYKALSGDSSDNIPGVRGIGEKTATELLKEFGSIEEIYNFLNQKSKIKNQNDNVKSKIKERTIKLLEEGRDLAFMSKELATIKIDVDFDFKLKDSRLHDFETKKVTEFLEKYRFRSLIKRLPQSHRIDGQQEKLF